MIDVARERAETPGVERRIHFHNCGAGLMSTSVLDAVKSHLDREGLMGGYEAAEAASAEIDATYASVASLLGCDVDEVAIVENATRAFDMVFYAMSFGPGDRILTSAAEYASNAIACLQMARNTGAEVHVVPNDETGQLDVDALEKMVDERVKLIVLTHVPTHGGLIQPAAAVGAMARRHSVPFLLDACQSVGQMPLDVDLLGCDMLAATSRKFLRGPRGVGFLYVRRPWIERLEPPFLDLHAATWTADRTYEIRGDARRFENWESNVAGRIGLGVAVDHALSLGLEAIRERIFSVAETLRIGIDGISGATVRDVGANRCGIVSFDVAGVAPDDLARALSRDRINIGTSTVFSTRWDMEPRGLDRVVRAGVHYYNSDEEVDAVVDAVARIARRA